MKADDELLVVTSVLNLMEIIAISVTCGKRYKLQKSSTFKPKKMLLMQQIGFSFCSIMQLIISSSESSDTTMMYSFMPIGYGFVYSSATA